jgi:hypothetical protein
MKWIAGLLGTMLATAGLAWALVTTGNWPLDDQKQPAMAIYALNGALGQWLVERGEPIPAAGTADRREAGGAATSGPFHERGSRASPAPAPAPDGLTAAELAAAREVLRTDPRFRGRVFTRTGINAGGSPGRG